MKVHPLTPETFPVSGLRVCGESRQPGPNQRRNRFLQFASDAVFFRAPRRRDQGPVPDIYFMVPEHLQSAGQTRA